MQQLNSMMSLPILTFHGLSKHKESNKYVVTEEDFVVYLEYLATHNYKCILAEDYATSLLERMYKLPEKSVMITFDDGHATDYTIALPILKKYNLKATFFITTDFIGQDGYMNPQQIKVLAGSGMSVQSHAKTHLFLDELSDDEIKIELDESKKKLENILGKPVQYISMPGGRYNNRVCEIARQENYTVLFCSAPYYLKKMDGINIVGRCMIRYAHRESNFHQVICPRRVEQKKTQLFYYLKYLLKKGLGKRFYYLLWKFYVKK